MSGDPIVQNTDPQLLTPEQQAAAEEFHANQNKIMQQEKELGASLPNATLAQKIQVLDWHRQSEKRSQVKTLRHFLETEEFAITRSTLNRWVQKEESLRKEYENLKLGSAYKTKPRYRYPEANRCLDIFYDQSLVEDAKHSEKTLVSKWVQFHKMYHGASSEELANMTSKTNGWMNQFKKRHLVKRNIAKAHFKARSDINVSTLSHEKLRLRELLSPYEPHQIYQLDEVSFRADLSLFGMYGASNGGTNGVMQDHRGSNNADYLPNLSFEDPAKRTVVALLANADGSSKFPPLVVSDEKYPITNGGSSIDVILSYNKNGLLTSEMVFNYLKQFDATLKEPIVILVDSFAAHLIPTEELENIELVFFTEELDSLHYRPLDFGILRLFKVLVKDSLLQLFLKKIMLGFNAPKDLHYSKTDLITYISEAWLHICRRPKMAAQCFKNSELISIESGPQDTITFDDAKFQDVKDIQRELQLIGLLKIFHDKNYSRFNQTIDSFIFPNDEKVVNFHMTESDIVSLVRREFEDPNFQLEESQDPHSSPPQQQQRTQFFEDSNETREVGSILFKKVKTFFEKNSNTESAVHFSRFMHHFVRESNSQFLKSFLGDSIVKEKIERKRRRDESVTMASRIQDFEDHSSTGLRSDHGLQYTEKRQQRANTFNDFALPAGSLNGPAHRSTTVPQALDKPTAVSSSSSSSSSSSTNINPAAATHRPSSMIRALEEQLAAAKAQHNQQHNDFARHQEPSSFFNHGSGSSRF